MDVTLEIESRSFLRSRHWSISKTTDWFLRKELLATQFLSMWILVFSLITLDLSPSLNTGAERLQ